MTLCGVKVTGGGHEANAISVAKLLHTTILPAHRRQIAAGSLIQKAYF